MSDGGQMILINGKITEPSLSVSLGHMFTDDLCWDVGDRLHLYRPESGEGAHAPQKHGAAKLRAKSSRVTLSRDACGLPGLQSSELAHRIRITPCVPFQVLN